MGIFDHMDDGEKMAMLRRCVTLEWREVETSNLVSLKGTKVYFIIMETHKSFKMCTKVVSY